MKNKKTILLFYFVVVIFFTCNIFVISAQNYQFPNTIKCTILSLQAKSSDSCNGRMDFYGTMAVNNQFYAFNNILEGNTIYPYWSGTAGINNSTTNQLNWIRIDIFDEDDSLCGGSDDLVDVSPSSYIAELVLRVDTPTMNVWDVSNSGNQPIHVGKVGQQITLHGFDTYTSKTFGGIIGHGQPVKGRNKNVETGVITFIVEFQ